jgi:hypothetical protein
LEKKMSRLFGEIRQLGFVVKDIEAAMRHWADVLQVGPWFLAERIQQRNDAPSVYRDFIAAGRTGLQHVAYWTENFDADMARAKAHGLKVIMGGEVGERGRYVYFDTELHPGSMVELSEIAGPKGRMFRMIREASETWDGRDPVRPFPNLAAL